MSRQLIVKQIITNNRYQINPKKIMDVEIIKTIKISVICIVLNFSFSFAAKANYKVRFQQSFFELGYKFQYILSVDKRISDKVTPELLIEIADSIS